jgi:hypothetical protein
MSRRQVTDEDRQRVLYLRGQGLGYTLIARQTGLGRTTVVRIIGAADEPLPANEYDLDSQPVGPEEHRAVRRALGLASAEDLLALNTEADPFYCGTPAHLREAEWFGDLWRSLGFPDGAHPRRVYYKAGSVPGVTKPDGSPFEYGELSWRLITRASRHARNLGTVDAELIRDMRGRGIAENVMVPGAGSSAGEERHPSAMLAGSDGEEWDGWPLHQLWLPDPRWWRMPSPEVSGYGYDVADQPVLVEVWPEKSTMDDILGPLCRDLGVNLASGKGFESITHSLALLRRAEQYPSRRAVVLYISRPRQVREPDAGLGRAAPPVLGRPARHRRGGARPAGRADRRSGRALQQAAAGTRGGRQHQDRAGRPGGAVPRRAGADRGGRGGALARPRPGGGAGGR